MFMYTDSNLQIRHVFTINCMLAKPILCVVEVEHKVTLTTIFGVKNIRMCRNKTTLNLSLSLV